MGVDGEHASHQRLLLQDLLGICEVHLAEPAGHFLLDDGPLDKPGIC